MKKWILFFTLFSLNSHALTLEFIGPCSSEPLLTINVKEAFDDVGSMTLHYLDREFIPYAGVASGFNSMFNTPVGLDSMEVLSDEEMRSYGWCFHVNDKLTETMPHETWLVPSVKKVQWFYGYAHYKQGQWISFCNPAHTLRPAFLCHK